MCSALVCGLIVSLTFSFFRYFKRFDIPEMDRLKLVMTDKALTHSFANNTLIVSYAKPLEVMVAVSFPCFGRMGEF